MSGKDFVRKLRKNGWKLDHVTGSHHILYKDGVTLSVPVHRNEDIGKGLYYELLKEAKKAGYEE
jgi:predicted RNA binding protein YcfA (HicA-like mRNA interferase family)